MSQLFTSGGQNIGSFSFNISPSNEHPGLISFRMDWLGLLAVQGTLKSFLQHHTLKASSHQRSAFFIVQLSHPYTTTGKTVALTRRTFVDKVMLCFLICCLLLLSHFSRVRLCATPEMAAHQAPPSMGFSRQEYWSGVPLALTRRTFVGKVMSLLFNMLSRLAPLTPIQFNKHV